MERLEVLKGELELHFVEKARLEEEKRQRAVSEANARTEKTNEKESAAPTEDMLLARLNRLNMNSNAKKSAPKAPESSLEEKKYESKVVEEPKKEEKEEETGKGENEALPDLSTFDLSIFEKKLKQKEQKTELDDHKLIPDVEIRDPRLDLSWLEEDPLFGSKSKSFGPSPTSSASTSSSPSLVIQEDILGDAPTPKLPKQSAPPPSYFSVKHLSSAGSEETSNSSSSSSPLSSAPSSSKYKVVTVISEPVAPISPIPKSSSPFSLPSGDMDSYDSFSITRTIRGQQFDASAMNQRLLDTTVDATCSTFISESSSSSIAVSQAPSHPSSSIPQYQQNSSGALSIPAQNGSSASPSLVMAPYSSPLATVSSQQQLAAMLPLMGNVPVVFKPSHKNFFDPAKSPSVVYASPSPPPKTSFGTSSKPSAPPPAYKAATGSKPKSSGSPSSSSSAAPKEKPPSYKKVSPQTSGGAKYAAVPSNGSSAFPLLTNQRASAAVYDASLRKIEMDGDMFDRFMYMANKNTVRGIETCGILAGSFLPHKKIFRVTHLIIPKQTGTTDTCATTNEDEIFEYQIKHDLLTLGWIHTHPTQACFLSSVDLHTHCSYQALFPEAVAVVIAPRDTPNFAFFHLSKKGFPIVQSCPLSGFHHHPERGLYEACSHIVLSWNSKKPCKVVDMR